MHNEINMVRGLEVHVFEASIARVSSLAFGGQWFKNKVEFVATKRFFFFVGEVVNNIDKELSGLLPKLHRMTFPFTLPSILLARGGTLWCLFTIFIYNLTCNMEGQPIILIFY